MAEATDRKQFLIDLAGLLSTQVPSEDVLVIEVASKVMEIIDELKNDELSPRDRMDVNAAAAGVRMSIREAKEEVLRRQRDPEAEERWLQDFISKATEEARNTEASYTIGADGKAYI